MSQDNSYSRGSPPTGTPLPIPIPDGTTKAASPLRRENAFSFSNEPSNLLAFTTAEDDALLVPAKQPSPARVDRVSIPTGLPYATAKPSPVPVKVEVAAKPATAQERLDSELKLISTLSNDAEKELKSLRHIEMMRWKLFILNEHRKLSKCFNEVYQPMLYLADNVRAECDRHVARLVEHALARCKTFAELTSMEHLSKLRVSRAHGLIRAGHVELNVALQKYQAGHAQLMQNGSGVSADDLQLFGMLYHRTLEVVGSISAAMSDLYVNSEVQQAYPEIERRLKQTAYMQKVVLGTDSASPARSESVASSISEDGGEGVLQTSDEDDD